MVHDVRSIARAASAAQAASFKRDYRKVANATRDGGSPGCLGNSKSCRTSREIQMKSYKGKKKLRGPKFKPRFFAFLPANAKTSSPKRALSRLFSASHRLRSLVRLGEFRKNTRFNCEMICSIFANCKNNRCVSLRSHEARVCQKQGTQPFPDIARRVRTRLPWGTGV